MKLVLVDDDRGIQEMFTEVMDYPVVVLNNGQDVIDYVDQNGLIDTILILDLRLPKVSGEAVLKTLKGKYDPASVAIWSGSISKDHKELESEVSNYFLKGGNMDPLRSWIKEVMSSQNLTQQAA